MEFVAIECAKYYMTMCKHWLKLCILQVYPSQNVQIFTITVHVVRPCSLEDSLAPLRTTEAVEQRVTDKWVDSTTSI